MDYNIEEKNRLWSLHSYWFNMQRKSSRRWKRVQSNCPPLKEAKKVQQSNA